MVSWFTQLVNAITQTLSDVGTAIFGFIKDGFIELFCTYTTSTTGEGAAAVTTKTISGPSIIAYFAFAMLGLTLAISLTKYITSLIRCKRSM